MIVEDEAIQKLDALKRSKTAHIEADEVLLRFLEAEGYLGVARAFLRTEERVGFWRA